MTLILLYNDMRKEKATDKGKGRIYPCQMGSKRRRET